MLDDEVKSTEVEEMVHKQSDLPQIAHKDYQSNKLSSNTGSHHFLRADWIAISE